MSKKDSSYNNLKDKSKKNPALQKTLQYLYMFFMCSLSAFLFAISFRLFISPSNGSIMVGENQIDLIYFVSGGVSGLSQNIVKIVIDIAGAPISRSVLQSILYFVLNIPILLLAWFKIGKRFAVFSAINVGLTSLFISIIPESFEQAVMLESQITRPIFAGILSGVSAATSFKANASSGGIDVISYYFANRKSKGVGKYSVIFNGVIVTIYFILMLVSGEHYPLAITSLIYSIIYLVVSAFIIDSINIRNKKTLLQIFTEDAKIAEILIENFPHGATTVDAIGTYTGEKRTIVYMTLSSTEVKSAIDLIKLKDPNAFVNVIELRQVYGRFYIPPIE